MVTIRDARLADDGRLLEIYAPYVRETAITFETEVPELMEFRQRMEHVRRRYPYLVAEEKGRILGYAYASAFHTRAAYDWAVETTIYVDRDCRHGGIGGSLYKALEAALESMGVLNLNACIAAPVAGIEDEHLTNDSEGFHAHLGYTLVGRFHKCGYKFGRWYDMIWMEKMLGVHVETPKPVQAYADLNLC
ncbi:phosphinothricin acetyltransferase [Selenomonas sp. GACV-9]|nr:phosphinothricin acetyltransferase [Selenomonas ruminantium]